MMRLSVANRYLNSAIPDQSPHGRPGRGGELNRRECFVFVEEQSMEVAFPAFVLPRSEK